MRKIGEILTVVMLVALLYYSALAAGLSVNITWTYDSPPSDLAGFHLFLNGTQVQDLNVPTATSWTGTLDFQDGNNTVGLTAYDSAGNESTPAEITVDPPPHSVTNLELHFQ